MRVPVFSIIGGYALRRSLRRHPLGWGVALVFFFTVGAISQLLHVVN